MGHALKKGLGLGVRGCTELEKRRKQSGSASVGRKLLGKELENRDTEKWRKTSFLSGHCSTICQKNAIKKIYLFLLCMRTVPLELCRHSLHGCRCRAAKCCRTCGDKSANRKFRVLVSV